MIICKNQDEVKIEQTGIYLKYMFNIFKHRFKKVNIYEVLIIIIIFSKATTSIKIKFILLLFDFDQVKDIDKEIFGLIIKTVTVAISKVFKFTYSETFVETKDI